MADLAGARPFWPLGIAEDEFSQRKPKRGLITKTEVRVVSLARLMLHPGDVVWDVGAGSGSVSIEASFLAPHGLVYAVEKNEADVEHIRTNIEKFGSENVVAVWARAPEGLDALPDPDAVFVGGTGGEMRQILEVVAERLRPGGRVVVNLATLENLHEAVEGLKELGFTVEVTMIQVARSKDVIGLTHLESFDPVFVVAAQCGPHQAIEPGEGEA